MDSQNLGFVCCFRRNKERAYWCLEVEIYCFKNVLGGGSLFLAIGFNRSIRLKYIWQKKGLGHVMSPHAGFHGYANGYSILGLLSRPPYMSLKQNPI